MNLVDIEALQFHLVEPLIDDFCLLCAVAMNQPISLVLMVQMLHRHYHLRMKEKRNILVKQQWKSK